MPRMSVKLAPWFLSFRKSKQFYPYLTFPTHCSSSSLIFGVPIPTYSEVADRKVEIFMFTILFERKQQSQ